MLLINKLFNNTKTNLFNLIFYSLPHKILMLTVPGVLFNTNSNIGIDFILFVSYYLNLEICLTLIIFVVILNKTFFRKHGFLEILFFIQLVLWCHIIWLIIVTFNPYLLENILYFPWREFFSNQYFYFFSTTDLQLRLLLVFNILIYLLLTLWNFYYLDFAKLQTLNLEIFIIFLSNIIFCSLLLKVNNLFALWCLIECLSITAYILTAFNSKCSIKYSFLYFIFNSIAGVLILWGITLILPFCQSDFFISYMIFDTLINYNFFTINWSFNLILIGFFMKLGLIPFHMWAVEVYKNISTELLFTFLIVNKTVLIFSIYRIVSIFVSDFNIFFESCNFFLIPIILITIFFGAIFASMENNLHAFIALSSLPQTGYVLLGFLNADFETRITALIYFILYIFTIVLFYYTLFFLQNSYTYISDFTGLFYTNKISSIFILLILGSFSSIPPFGTFIAKFYLFNNLALTHSIWIVLFLLINSVISIIYYLRFAITLLTPCTKEFIILPLDNPLSILDLPIEKITSDSFTHFYYRIKIIANIGFLIFLNLAVNFSYIYILEFFNI